MPDATGHTPPGRSGPVGRPSRRRGTSALLAALAATAVLTGALFSTGPSGARPDAVALEVSGAGVVGYLPLGPHDRLGVLFVHSVDLLPVEDWYLLRDGALVQESTRLRQYGAGMGHIPGVGTGRADGDWWEVTGMNQHIGVLELRIGPPSVNHRLRHPGGEIALSDCWPGRRLTVRPVRAPVTAPFASASRPACDISRQPPAGV